MYYPANAAQKRAIERVLNGLAGHVRRAMELVPEVKDAIVHDLELEWKQSQLAHGARGRAIKKWAANHLVWAEKHQMVPHMILRAGRSRPGTFYEPQN